MLRGELLALAAGLSCVASTASAQASNKDFQVWSYVTVRAPLAARVDLSVDLHAALIDDASKANQALARAILSYKLGDRFSIGGGYTFVTYHDAPALVFEEHRITQEVSFRSTTAADRPLLTLRPRLEERFRKGEDGTSVRLRHLTRLDLPVSSKGLRLVAWNETFYVLNDTSWAKGHRFDVMLDFVGLGIPLSGKVAFEPGYVNFRIFRRGAPDQVAHAIGLFMTARL